MRTNMPPTGDQQVNEKPFRIAINLRESAPFYPLDLQKTVNWQRKYVQERAEAAAVANQKADKPAANAAPRPEMHPESPQYTPAVPGSVETHIN
jgi:hypothetical protein